jgi:hypothetical protein
VSSQWKFDGWCYFRERQQLGPIPTGEIVRLVNVGELQPEDVVLALWTVANQRRVIRSRARAALDFESC